MINLNAITFPTPEPYNTSEPTKQLENFCYIGQQILAQLKTVNDGQVSDLTDLIHILELQSFVVDFGVFKVEIHGPKAASVLYR